MIRKHITTLGKVLTDKNGDVYLGEVACKKDWYIDDRPWFKKGERYTIVKESTLSNGAYGIRVKHLHRRIWFWEGSEYFDVTKGMLGE